MGTILCVYLMLPQNHVFVRGGCFCSRAHMHTLSVALEWAWRFVLNVFSTKTQYIIPLRGLDGINDGSHAVLLAYAWCSSVQRFSLNKLSKSQTCLQLSTCKTAKAIRTNA
jgi:hypothetical protein